MRNIRRHRHLLPLQMTDAADGSRKPGTSISAAPTRRFTLGSFGTTAAVMSFTRSQLIPATEATEAVDAIEAIGEIEETGVATTNPDSQRLACSEGESGVEVVAQKTTCRSSFSLMIPMTGMSCHWPSTR